MAHRERIDAMFYVLRLNSAGADGVVVTVTATAGDPERSGDHHRLTSRNRTAHPSDPLSHVRNPANYSFAPWLADLGLPQTLASGLGLQTRGSRRGHGGDDGDHATALNP